MTLSMNSKDMVIKKEKQINHIGCPLMIVLLINIKLKCGLNIIYRLDNKDNNRSNKGKCRDSLSSQKQHNKVSTYK